MCQFGGSEKIGSARVASACVGVRGSASHIEPEMQDVAVLDDVLRAFEAEFARFLGALLAAAGDEVLVGDRFGADEALLKVGVDDAGGLGRLGAAPHRPGARLLGTDGEES